MQAIIILILILAVLLVVFTLQNTAPVSITLFFWKIPGTPLVLVIIVCLILGCLLAAVYYSPLIWRLKRKNRQLEKLIPETGEGENDDDIPFEVEKPDDPEGIELDDDSGNSFFKD